MTLEDLDWLDELLDEFEQEGWLPELRTALEADREARACPETLRLARAH